MANPFNSYAEQLAEQFGFDDEFENAISVKTYDSLSHYNFDQFMKKDKFFPLHHSQVYTKDGKCYLKCLTEKEPNIDAPTKSDLSFDNIHDKLMNLPDGKSELFVFRNEKYRVAASLNEIIQGDKYYKYTISFDNGTLGGMNFNKAYQFLKNEYTRLDESQRTKQEPYNILENNGKRGQFLFNYNPNNELWRMSSEEKLQHVFNINEVNDRINMKDRELSRLNKELQDLNRDKGLYDRLNNYIEVCSDEFHKENNNIVGMSPFQKLLNAGKIAKHEVDRCRIGSRIEKGLKNHGFKDYSDFINKAEKFLNTYDQNRMELEDKIDDARDNIKAMHGQKDILKNRIKEIVCSIYEKEYPEISKLDETAHLDIYEVNINSGKIHNIKELASLSPYSKELENVKNAASAILKGVLPEKNKIHSMAYDR